MHDLVQWFISDFKWLGAQRFRMSCWILLTNLACSLLFTRVSGGQYSTAPEQSPLLLNLGETNKKSIFIFVFIMDNSTACLPNPTYFIFYLHGLLVGPAPFSRKSVFLCCLSLLNIWHIKCLWTYSELLIRCLRHRYAQGYRYRCRSAFGQNCSLISRLLVDIMSSRCD